VDYASCKEATEQVARLLDAHLPTEVESDGNFRDWNVAGPGLLAVAHQTLRSVMRQDPHDGGGPDAKVLTRTLIEQCITWVWLAGDPATRLDVWAVDLDRERLKFENKVMLETGGRAEYREVIQKYYPAGVLNDEIREAAEQAAARDVATVGQFEKARLADERWAPEIAEVKEFPYGAFWAIAFGGYNFNAHPSVLVVADVVLGQGDRLLVGAPVVREGHDEVYLAALRVFLHTLLVAELVLGWPDSSAVRAITV
jgi:hypothetical protein